MASLAMQHEEARRRRKVEPIYQLIDSYNWKGALKLCEKKDVKDWDIVKTLRAHVLERLGRTDEACGLILEVKQKKPTDGSILAALTSTLNLQGKRDEAAECYRNALEVDPNNLELAQEVLFGFAKSFQFQKQQQLATKMYKRTAQSHYVFYGAAAILLQARQGGLAQMLTLGERMVKRELDTKQAARSGAKPSAEEFRLYIALLREQKKIKEALDAVVEHGAGEVALGAEKQLSEGASQIVDEGTLEQTGVPSEFLMMQPSERLELEAHLREDLEDWVGAQTVWANLVRHVPDQWSYHTGYLDALFALAALAKVDEQFSVFAPARQLCRDLQAQHPLSRAPYLAEIELLKRFAVFQETVGGVLGKEADQDKLPLPPAWLPESSEGQQSTMNVQDTVCSLIGAYIDRFGSKLCCSMDLQPYLSVIAPGNRFTAIYTQQVRALLDAKFEETRSTSPAAQEALAAAMAVEVGETGGDMQRQHRTKQLHKHITCCQCRRFLGAHAFNGDAASADALRAEVRALADEFRATLDVNEGAAGGQREVQHGDELLILAAHMLRDLWQDASCDNVYRCQLDALLLLEYGRSCSPYNYHFKLELMRIYEEVGCFAGGLTLYNELDVKHVQLDSLSWLIFPGLYSCGFFEEAGAQCRMIMRLHQRTAVDSGEYISKAYLNGNYSKAIEITEFQQQRMTRSMQYALARGDYANIELLLSRHALGEAKKYLVDLVAGKLNESLSIDEDDIAKLSVNHDWTVRLSWPTPGSSPPSYTDVVSMKRRLRLRMVVPRILLACLNGDTDTLADHISTLRGILAFDGGAASGKAEVSSSSEDLPAAFAALSISSTNVPSAAKFEELCWRQTMQLFEAHLVVNRSNKTEGEDDISAQLSVLPEKLIGSLTESVRSMTSVLTGPGVKHSMIIEEGSTRKAVEGSGQGDDKSPLTASWLACVCIFLESSGLYLPILVQNLVKATPAPEKKKKGKKGKKSTVAGGENKPQLGSAELIVAVRALLKATTENLSSLRSILRMRNVSAEAFAETFTAADSLFPEDLSGEFDPVRAEASRALAASQNQTVENRLMPLLQAKLSALQAASI